MPSFQGRVDEEQLLQLVTYIKSLGTQPDHAVTVLPPQGNAEAPGLAEAWQGEATATLTPPQRKEAQP